MPGRFFLVDAGPFRTRRGPRGEARAEERDRGSQAPSWGGDGDSLGQARMDVPAGQAGAPVRRLAPCLWTAMCPPRGLGAAGSPWPFIITAPCTPRRLRDAKPPRRAGRCRRSRGSPPTRAAAATTPQRTWRECARSHLAARPPLPQPPVGPPLARGSRLRAVAALGTPDAARTGRRSSVSTARTKTAGSIRAGRSQPQQAGLRQL